MKKWMVMLLLGSLMMGVWSCDDEDDKEEQPVDLELNFTATFNDAPLYMYDGVYPYDGDMDVKFQLFQFYISDVSLLKEEKSDGDSLELIDIALISFGDVLSPEEAAEGVSVYAEQVPAGVYRGITFGIGVSPELNATQPGDYTPPHPLDDHYWSWARGYVFSKIEGNGDFDRDGVFEEKLTFHTGENQFYREYTLMQDIEVKTGADKLHFNVDLYDVLKAQSDDFLDFRKVTQDHTNDLNVAKFISDNLENAIRME